MKKVFLVFFVVSMMAISLIVGNGLAQAMMGGGGAGGGAGGGMGGGDMGSSPGTMSGDSGSMMGTQSGMTGQDMTPDSHTHKGTNGKAIDDNHHGMSSQGKAN